MFVYYNFIYINRCIIICIAYKCICILKHFFQKFSELPLETICFKFFHKIVKMIIANKNMTLQAKSTIDCHKAVFTKDSLSNGFFH